MLRRLAIAAALLIAIPLVAIPCWIAAHRSDLPSPGDEDLAVTRSVVPAGANGFDELVAAAELRDWPEDADDRLKAIRSGEVSDPAWVRSMLARNAAAIAALDRALDALFFRAPYETTSPDTFDEIVPTLIGAQALVSLVGFEARLQLAARNWDGAIERALLGMRVGHMLGQSEDVTLLWLMFAHGSQARSLADLEAIVRTAPSDPRAARRLASRLEALRLRDGEWKRVWAAEYQYSKALLGDADMSEGESWVWQLFPGDYLWQPNRTLASAAERYRILQRRSALACREAYQPRPTREEWGRRRWKVILSPNPIGGLLEIATPDFDRFELKRCHLETNFALLETLIAAKAHWQEHHELPERLDDLVPAYLPAVPEDRFAGAPLRYDRSRAVAWSLGDDFVDAGGGEHPDPSNASEPGISLAF